jgi:DNA-binding LacI/PurR family transcriptional regulator
VQALRQAGRRVPDDGAIVGFDDIEAARFTDPPLTTVRQPIVEVARAIVRRLLVPEEERQAAEPLILPTELVVRDSTGPLPAGRPPPGHRSPQSTRISIIRSQPGQTSSAEGP